MHVIIVGAGPSGLAAALALHQQSTPDAPITVTVLELRPRIETIGGAVNMTPLALRYLDALGVGARLRPRGVKCRFIELVSHRTGASLGRLWPDVDALRVGRHDIVDSLLGAVRDLPGEGVAVRFGVRIQEITETGTADGAGCVQARLVDTATGLEEVLEADLLIGCDGIHSFVRGSYVDPTRKKAYSGRAGAYGYVKVDEPGKTGIHCPNGEPTITDTTLVAARMGSLLMSFFEPSRSRLYVAAVISEKEREDAKDGWKATGEDKEVLKKDMLRRFSGGALQGLESELAKCEDWFFFPVYMLPAGGTWVKGRALLIGDAAHAMPPQGESTGVAIEDGVLLAHVLSRRGSRSVAQMLADYEALRRAPINKIFDETAFRWNDAGEKGWLRAFILEWLTRMFLMWMNWTAKDHFAGDVRTLALPA